MKLAEIENAAGRFPLDELTPALNKTVIDRREQIHSDARAAKLLSIKVPVLVFVNNHFAGTKGKRKCRSQRTDSRRILARHHYQSHDLGRCFCNSGLLGNRAGCLAISRMVGLIL